MERSSLKVVGSEEDGRDDCSLGSHSDSVDVSVVDDAVFCVVVVVVFVVVFSILLLITPAAIPGILSRSPCT